MIANNWLVNYAKLEGVKGALQGMASRASFPSSMARAGEDLQQDYQRSALQMVGGTLDYFAGGESTAFWSGCLSGILNRVKYGSACHEFCRKIIYLVPKGSANDKEHGSFQATILKTKEQQKPD